MPPMSYPPLDVLAIGNAIVDVIATTHEAFLGSEGLVKGSMRLIDAEEATRLYGRMAPSRETSGGSAANTAAGVAALECRAGYIGRVAPDEPGGVVRHDIRALSVQLDTPAGADETPTARCHLPCTSAATRQMNPFLGPPPTP